MITTMYCLLLTTQVPIKQILQQTTLNKIIKRTITAANQIQIVPLQMQQIPHNRIIKLIVTAVSKTVLKQTKQTLQQTLPKTTKQIIITVSKIKIIHRQTKQIPQTTLNKIM